MILKKIIFIKTINQIVLLHHNEFTRSLFITLYNCTYKENSNSFIAKIKKIKLKIFNDYIPIEFQNDLTTNNLRKIKKFLVVFKKNEFKFKPLINDGLFDSIYNCIKSYHSLINNRLLKNLTMIRFEDLYLRNFLKQFFYDELL